MRFFAFKTERLRKKLFILLSKIRLAIIRHYEDFFNIIFILAARFSLI